MKIFENINNLYKSVSFISLFIILSSIGNLKVIGSGNKTDLEKFEFYYNQIDKINSNYSIPYSEYDNLDKQLKTFFGLHNQKTDQSYYPDLSIISDSDYIRQMFRSHLNDMTTNKMIYNIKNESFLKY